MVKQIAAAKTHSLVQVSMRSEIWQLINMAVTVQAVVI